LVPLLGLEEETFRESRKSIIETDPDFLKDEAINTLTRSIDDEIMGIKEELHEDGYSEADITRAIEEVGTRIENEKVPPTLEGIREILSKEITRKPTEVVKPALSPTAKDQFNLPGMKQGLQFPSKGKEVTPTLEGTPLGEAGKKVEQERVQPGLFKKPVLEEKGVVEEPEPTTLKSEKGFVAVRFKRFSPDRDS
jgi:hypothetical protein